MNYLLQSISSAKYTNCSLLTNLTTLDFFVILTIETCEFVKITFDFLSSSFGARIKVHLIVAIFAALRFFQKRKILLGEF